MLAVVTPTEVCTVRGDPEGDGAIGQGVRLISGELPDGSGELGRGGRLECPPALRAVPASGRDSQALRAHAVAWYGSSVV